MQGKLSVFVSGVAYCRLEPITLRLTEDADLGVTPYQVSWLIAIIEAGCIVSPVIAGYLADRSDIYIIS